MANKKYDPYKDVQSYTYNLGEYQKTGNLSAQQAAVTSLTNLRKNGYSDIADQFVNADYAGAKKISDDYVKNNKVNLKPYLYGSKLKTEYGLSDSEIDNLINIDEASGIMQLGPTSFGSPYATIDGETYWDSSSLDSSIDEFISMTGLTPKASAALPDITSESIGANEEINIPYTSPTDNSQILFNKQYNDSKKLDGKYDELYDYAMHENPFETPEGKAIMADYDLKALQGRDNAAASGAALNGGNIDSYAAANGLRQQAALTAKGQQAAIAAQTERINNVRGILGDIYNTNMGEDAGMLNTIKFQQSEQQRMHENNYDIAGITGYVPGGWIRASNPYFGDDGTLKNPDMDYSLEIERLKEAKANETDPAKLADIDTQINYLLDAHAYKTSPDNYGGKWSEYAGKDFGVGYSPTHTLPSKQTDKQVEYSNEASKKQMAYDMLITMAGAGIPPSATLLSEAGYGGMSPDEFMTTFKNSRDSFISDDKRATAIETLFNAVASGMPISRQMLDDAGYSDMTPEGFASMYNTNLGNIYETQKKNPDLTASSSGRKSSGGGGSSYSAGSTAKDKLSKTDKQKIMTHINEDGGAGLRALLDTYDWDKYDADDVVKYISDNFADDEEVMAVVYDYFGIEHDGSDNGGFDALGYAKNVAETLNKKYNSDSSEYGDEFEPISEGANGTFRVSSWASNAVIDAIVNDNSLTDEEKISVLELFGFTIEQLTEYLNNDNY